MQILGQSASNPLSQENTRLAQESGIALLHDAGNAERDFLHYKEQEEAERHRGLDELVAEAQKLGMSCIKLGCDIRP